MWTILWPFTLIVIVTLCKLPNIDGTNWKNSVSMENFQINRSPIQAPSSNGQPSKILLNTVVVSTSDPDEQVTVASSAVITFLIDKSNCSEGFERLSEISDLNFTSSETKPDDVGSLHCISWLCPRELTTAFCNRTDNGVLKCHLDFHRNWNPLKESGYKLTCTNGNNECVRRDSCHLEYSTEFTDHLKVGLVLLNGVLLLFGMVIVYVAAQNRVKTLLRRRRRRRKERLLALIAKFAAAVDGDKSCDVVEMNVIQQIDEETIPEESSVEIETLHELNKKRKLNLKPADETYTRSEGNLGIKNRGFLMDNQIPDDTRTDYLSDLEDIPEEEEETSSKL